MQHGLELYYLSLQTGENMFGKDFWRLVKQPNKTVQSQQQDKATRKNEPKSTTTPEDEGEEILEVVRRRKNKVQTLLRSLKEMKD